MAISSYGNIIHLTPESVVLLFPPVQTQTLSYGWRCSGLFSQLRH